MHRTLCAIALTCASAAHALEARDYDADGTVDAYFDRAAGLTWQARPQYESGFVDVYVDQIKVGGVQGWKLPSVDELGSLVYGALGNTPQSFEEGTVNTGPFGRWFCWETWIDERVWTDYAATAGADGRLGSVYVFEQLPAWLMQRGDPGASLGTVSPAPEPGTWALMGVGLALLVAARSTAMQRSTALASRSLPAAR